LIQDLIKSEVLFVDEYKQLIEKWTAKENKKYNIDKPEIYKVVTGNSSDALVRFRVISPVPDEPKLWENTKIFAKFQDYLAEKMKLNETEDYCYVTGQKMPLTERHGS